MHSTELNLEYSIRSVRCGLSGQCAGSGAGGGRSTTLCTSRRQCVAVEPETRRTQPIPYCNTWGWLCEPHAHRRVQM